jgi:hypothetical protein
MDQARMGWEGRIKRGNQNLGRVQSGAHLGGFDQRCLLSGLMVYADFDRSLAAGGIAGL